MNKEYSFKNNLWFVVLVAVMSSMPAAFAEEVAVDMGQNAAMELHRRSAAIGLALYINNSDRGVDGDQARAMLLEKMLDTKSDIERAPRGLGVASERALQSSFRNTDAGKQGGRELKDAEVDDQLKPGWQKLPDLPEQASVRAQAVLNGLKEGVKPGKRASFEKSLKSLEDGRKLLGKLNSSKRLAQAQNQNKAGKGLKQKLNRGNKKGFGKGNNPGQGGGNNGGGNNGGGNNGGGNNGGGNNGGGNNGGGNNGGGKGPKN